LDEDETDDMDMDRELERCPNMVLFIVPLLGLPLPIFGEVNARDEDDCGPDVDVDVADGEERPPLGLEELEISGMVFE
jgi:hypothetical protein